MPIRDRITWGPGNPLSDPRLVGLDRYVKDLRQRRIPPNVTGGSIFRNVPQDLPARPFGYYREYDIAPPVPGQGRGILRIVLGHGGDVYITGNHYRDFRQVIDMPT